MSCVPVLHQSMRTIIPVDGVADSANPSGETGSAPDAVTDLAAGAPGATSVSYTWTMPEGATATFYRADVTAAGSFVEIASGITSVPYNDTGLDPENQYQAKVRLTNEYGTSADSNVVSVTTTELGEAPLVLSGSFTHGGSATLTTDGSYSFGARTNAKPVYVYAGESSKNGSTLGRMTGDYFNAAVEYQTVEKSGGFAGAMKYDFKGTSQGSFGPLEIANELNPFIIYKHILRNFDQNDPDYQNEEGGFNLKTHRLYGTDGGVSNFYVGRDGFGFVENIAGNFSRYFAYTMPTFEWADELLYFINSTAENVMDGRFYQIVDNVWLNTIQNDESDYDDDTRLITYNATHPSPLNWLYLDQLSNGSGSGEEITEVPEYLDYIFVDDEVRQVWIGNASTIGACTKLYPTPTVTWADAEIDFVPLFADIAPENAYVYISTAWDRATNVKTWATTNGVQPA